MAIRSDLQLITSWITPASKVLDLGCGDGQLLSELQEQYNCAAYGVEIDYQSILTCLEKKVNVIQADINNGIKNFEDNSFDTVIMSQSLQAMSFPDKTILEMLRIGKEAVISFPNMGYWSARLQLLLGKMPVTKTLPHNWFDTPNIHLCTLKDFKKLCSSLNIEIIEEVVLNNQKRSHFIMRLLPNAFAQVAIFRIKLK